MPMPSVEPMPLPPRLSRFELPDEAQEASYLAASARMASFCWRSSCGMSSTYVLYPCLASSSSVESAETKGLTSRSGDMFVVCSCICIFGMEYPVYRFAISPQRIDLVVEGRSCAGALLHQPFQSPPQP